MSKLTDTVGKAMSAPVRAWYKFKGEKADNGRRALKLDQQAKGVPADPQTAFGRELITSRHTANDLRKKYRISSDGVMKK